MVPLEGIRILDLAHLQPGAFCTMILGDLGAEVIKVESPAEVSGFSPVDISSNGTKKKQTVFDPLHRNKKSIILNMKSEAGRQIFYELTKTADVVVEGFRPGVVGRLGVDYQTIKAINPKVIYCSLSGYGQDGPYSNLPGHDINYISMAGILSQIGTTDGLPIVPLNLLADFAGASLHSAIGILTALLARGKTGRGQHVDIAYLDGAMSLLTWLAGVVFHSGVLPKRGETVLHCAYPYYNVYETRDGKFISLGCIEPWFWKNLCHALNKEEYASYHYMPEHILNRPEDNKWWEISAFLKETFLTKTREEWFELLTNQDVPVAKVQTMDEVFLDPQVLHRRMVLEIEHPDLGKVKQLGIAIKLSDTPGKVRSFSPLPGQHTDTILKGIGYRQTQIAELRQSKVIA